MASVNKSILIILAVLFAISLLGAYLALHDSAARNPIVGAPVAHTPVAPSTESTREIAPVTTHDVTVKTVPPTAAAATNYTALSPQRAAKLALRVDLQYIYYLYSGEVIGFEHMSDAQIFALLDDLELQMKSGDTHAALKWLDLATTFCGKSVFFRADKEVPLDYNLAVLDRLPANETQFTKEYMLEFNSAELEHINARRQQCESKTSEILSNSEGMEQFLSANGSVVGFLAAGKESLFEQVQLLGSSDQLELMALPDPLRAQMVEQMLIDSNTFNRCDDVQVVLPYILHGTGPKLLAMQARIAQSGCDTPLLDVPEPLQQLEQAAGYGDRAVINQYLEQLEQSNADGYRIENAAWLDFEIVLARSFCYGNQTMNVLARYYHESDEQHSGLSVLEATEAQMRTEELQAMYLQQAKQHLGCAFGAP